ncbi:hypothetical protein SELMODRAFT_426017 [Selaginella moellendorffii]|uniref:Uncharacterized protein n=1 Tax=Selaginella moellendorffii TaxID=88036 RepID=D8SV23_SELML|nr:hypothetical protein SELMODRAFT_426017 [Selaginella moellendorffii]
MACKIITPILFSPLCFADPISRMGVTVPYYIGGDGSSSIGVLLVTTLSSTGKNTGKHTGNRIEDPSPRGDSCRNSGQESRGLPSTALAARGSDRQQWPSIKRMTSMSVPEYDPPPLPVLEGDNHDSQELSSNRTFPLVQLPSRAEIHLEVEELKKLIGERTWKLPTTLQSIKEEMWSRLLNKFAKAAQQDGEEQPVSVFWQRLQGNGTSTVRKHRRPPDKNSDEQELVAAMAEESSYKVLKSHAAAGSRKLRQVDVSSTPVWQSLRGDGTSTVGMHRRFPYKNSEEHAAAMAEESSYKICQESDVLKSHAATGIPSQKLLASGTGDTKEASSNASPPPASPPPFMWRWFPRSLGEDEFSVCGVSNGSSIASEFIQLFEGEGISSSDAILNSLLEGEGGCSSSNADLRLASSNDLNLQAMAVAATPLLLPIHAVVLVALLFLFLLSFLLVIKRRWGRRNRGLLSSTFRCKCIRMCSGRDQVVASMARFSSAGSNSYIANSFVSQLMPKDEKGCMQSLFSCKPGTKGRTPASDQDCLLFIALIPLQRSSEHRFSHSSGTTSPESLNMKFAAMPCKSMYKNVPNGVTFTEKENIRNVTRSVENARAARPRPLALQGQVVP